MAFTATANVPLAATTTGSWPRPAWYGQSLWGRPLDTAMLDPIYREQFSDALAVVVSDQERAGLDIVTCGDYFLDADLAGRSWHHYPLQRWRGLAYDELQPENTRSDLIALISLAMRSRAQLAAEKPDPSKAVGIVTMTAGEAPPGR